MGLTPQGRHLSSLGSSEQGHSEASPNPSVFTPQLDHGQHSSFDLHSIFLLPCSDTECEVTLTGTKLSASGGAANTGDNNATTVQRTIRVPGIGYNATGYNATNPTSTASSAQLSETVHFSLPPPIAGKVRYRRTVPPASPPPTIITTTSSSSSLSTIPPLPTLNPAELVGAQKAYGQLQSSGVQYLYGDADSVEGVKVDFSTTGGEGEEEEGEGEIGEWDGLTSVSFEIAKGAEARGASLEIEALGYAVRDC